MERRDELMSGLIARRISRRDFLKVSAAAAVVAPLGGMAGGAGPRSTLGFAELKRGKDAGLHVPEGYEAQTLLRWGDPLVKGLAPFDPATLDAKEQGLRFGFNCDFVGYLPLPRGSRASDRGVLGVNHEYTTPKQMLPPERNVAARRGDVAEVEWAATGFTVVEIARDAKGRWGVDLDGARNRRVTLTTPIAIAGPAAGHARMRTTADPEGLRVLGTLANCAGGVTPWGTFLTCEENVQDWFGGACSDGREAANLERYGIPDDDHDWARVDPRFDLGAEPREPNRFGWVVEIDPHDPQSTPVKRTALGRFRHEGATCTLAPDGRVVVYSGDDQRGEYLYRYVSRGVWDPDRPASRAGLLDDGVLSVARFEDDGRLVWLPLVHGRGPLTTEHFADQGELLIETRRAADLVGATPMDRPEDVETNPATGLVYVMLTNNTKREPAAVDAANPRARNVHGHVLELHPPVTRGRRDHAADTMRWEVFLLAGDPESEDDGAAYQGAPISRDGWLSCPDNCAFDARGRLWIATDGSEHTADGIYACDTLGPGRALTRLFLRGPIGAEICGPCFTPDDRTLFCAIQHPGGAFDWNAPPTRWPDFDEALPPRPSVVAVVRRDGGVIGEA